MSTPNHPPIFDKEELRDLIRETVSETFTQLGVQYSSPLEMQKDFQHLREWRLSVESVKSKTMLAIVGVFVSGTLGALWLGLKEVLSK
jgi:hypothetical protein